MLFGIILKFLLNWKLNNKGYKGVKIGIHEKEFGVKLNQLLLVFGEVVINHKLKTLKMENP